MVINIAPGLELVSKDDYKGDMQLPQDANFVIVGNNEIKEFPTLEQFNNIIDEHKIKKEDLSAIDLSAYGNFDKIPEYLTTQIDADVSLVPGLTLMKKENYKGNIHLPGQVKYVLVGSEKLTELPSDYKLYDLHKQLYNKFFVTDFSKCINLKSIPGKFFSETETLVSADLSGCDKLRCIWNGSFALCTNLETVFFPHNICTIKDYAFESTKLRFVNLFNTNVDYISNSAFSSNFNLENVVGPRRALTIEDYAFANCHYLKNFKLFSDVEILGMNAFKLSGISPLKLLCDAEKYKKVNEQTNSKCNNIENEGQAAKSKENGTVEKKRRSIQLKPTKSQVQIHLSELKNDALQEKKIEIECEKQPQKIEAKSVKRETMFGSICKNMVKCLKKSVPSKRKHKEKPIEKQ